MDFFGETITRIDNKTNSNANDHSTWFIQNSDKAWEMEIKGVILQEKKDKRKAIKNENEKYENKKRNSHFDVKINGRCEML